MTSRLKIHTNVRQWREVQGEGGEEEFDMREGFREELRR